MKYLIIFLLLFTSWSAFAVQGELQELELAASERWVNFEQNQADSSWVEDQANLSLSGLVYSKGWLNPKVSRQIIPDTIKGWLTIDTVTLGPSLIRNLTTLSANILFAQYVPLSSFGTIKEKSFVNVRHYESYKEALLAKRFRLDKFPLKKNDFKNLEKGEILTTVTTGGIYTRFGGGIMNLIGLELPANFNFGPKAKFTVKESLKLSISKKTDNKVLLSIERAKDIGAGLGIGFGIFFEDIIDIPVTVGINTSSGYSPVIFNYKTNKQKLKAIIYEIDLSTKEGELAYERFMQKDLTAIEDLLKIKSSAVTIDLIKESKQFKKEVNGAIDLLIWRSGFRNIFVKSKINTTTRNGNNFEYMEISREDIKDRKRGASYENISMKYSALVPVRSSDKKNIINSFVLDTRFLYSDTKTLGEEIIEVQKMLAHSGAQLRLPIRVNSSIDYGRVNINVKVRFSSDAIKQIFNSTAPEVWEGLGYAFGIDDPLEWTTSTGRNYFFDQELLDKAQQIYRTFKALQAEPNPSKRANKLIKKLRKGESGHSLHRILMELANPNQLFIRGFIRGQHF